MKTVLLLLEEDLEFNELISNTVLELSCQKGHHVAEILVQKFCKCLCKNFVKRKSDNVRDISMETERKKENFKVTHNLVTYRSDSAHCCVKFLLIVLMIVINNV